MGLFGKKESLIVSEVQKDELIEKLEDANIKYTLNVEKNFEYKNEVIYRVRAKAEDLKKVV
ncbi:MAG: hypothetical protein IKS48_11230 [Eubacterium sp.]|nr:hypothetical protein [Eubacterium sp.]